MAKEIPLINSEQHALVDDKDYEWCRPWLNTNHSLCGIDPAARDETINGEKTTILMHNQIIARQNCDD